MTKNTQTTKKARTSRATKKAPAKSARVAKTTKTARAAKAPTAPTAAKPKREPSQEPKEPAVRKPRERDARIPPAGSKILRPYKGREIKVAVLEDGFRWEGEEFRSLSSLARRVTGAASINGLLFFRLTGAKAAPATPANGRKPKGKPATTKEAAPEPAPAAETATA